MFHCDTCPGQSEEKEDLVETRRTRQKETADSVAEFIKDHYAERLVADGNVKDEETDVLQDAAMHAGTVDGSADCEVDSEVDSEKKELPKHIEIVTQVGYLLPGESHFKIISRQV